jgi:hypothetical protein
MALVWPEQSAVQFEREKAPSKMNGPGLPQNVTPERSIHGEKTA